jgi:TIR domain
MRRWFLSYNSQDLGLMQSLEAALRRKDTDAKIFFAPKSLRAGGLWLPELARAIAEASVFVLLIGEKGIGPWQVIEYYEALDRRVKENDFPVVLVLLAGQPVAYLDTSAPRHKRSSLCDLGRALIQPNPMSA